MAAPGVRARNFIQPTPGGASAIFARQRGMMVAPASVATSVTQENPRVKESRFGKATGRDYANFLGKEENTSVIKSAVNALKNLLVGTFVAAKSLGATLKGVIKQIKGMTGGGGGGGIFKTLGMIGLVGAVIAGVAAIFGPQIKKAFEFLKGGAENIFQVIKEKLTSVDKNIEGFYEKIRDYLNNKIIPVINLINTVVSTIKDAANQIFHLPGHITVFGKDFNIPGMGKLKEIGKDVYGHLNNFGTIDLPPKLPPYRDIVDSDGNIVEKGLLGSSGLNFLSSYDTLGSLGSAMMTGAGNLAMGGIENTTGFIGDIINNIIAALGLTGQANSMGNSLGMGNLFGESRELGSGPGIPSLIQQNQQNQQSGTGQKPNYGQGRVPTAVAGDKEFQQGVTDLAKKYNLNEEDLYGVMSFESAGTFDPAKRNMQGSGATGLIQFTEPTAKGLGTTTAELAKMSRIEQLKYVDKYFASGPTIQGGNLDDLYMSILFPAAVGKPDDYVLFGKGAMPNYRGIAYDQNAGLDKNGDGSVTKIEAADDVRKHMAQMKFTAPAAPVQSTPPVTPVPSTKKVPQKGGTPVSFINLPMQGQAKPMVASRPSPAQSPRNPGGGGSPNIPHPPSTHPDDLNMFDLGIYT